MNRKQTLIILFWAISIPMVMAQNIEQIKADREHFLYGEGWGETLKLADNAALSELTSKISVNVQSDFSTVEHEGTQGTSFISETDYHSVINTYSQSTLTNTERIVLKNEPDAHVFRYIRKSEINRIFEGRKNKIIELAGIAEAADEKNQVDDALRYYYWSYVLLKSMRYPNEVKYVDADSDEQLLATWLPYRINQILGALSVEYRKRNDSDQNVAELYFSYKGQPVRSVEYTFFDGIDWSNVYSARDGVGIIELRPQSPDNIQVKFEYECYGEALIDSEIGEVLKAVKGEVFRKAYASVNMGNHQMTPNAQEEPNHSQHMTKKETHASATLSMDNSSTGIYRDIVNKVSKAILAKSYATVKDYFTAEGYGIFEKLIKYGQARLVGTPQLAYFPTDKEVYCRNLMMSFSFANNARKFVENVTFTFNPQHKITNITFGLDKQATDDILRKDSWDNASKMVLINFLENYKTAYALKRWDYINSIFSDDALIITGRVMKRAALGKEEMMGNNKYVEFTRQNKTNYMKRLKQTFQRNEFINLRFADNKLTKMGKSGELYGIQIKQDYFSTYYGDTGYLFLMVDLNKPEEPIIHVRTWQPERDPDFGVIGPGHF